MLASSRHFAQALANGAPCPLRVLCGFLRPLPSLPPTGALGVGCEHSAVIPRLGGVLIPVVVLLGNGHRSDVCERRAEHGWLAACSAKSRRAQWRRAGGARCMRGSHPVPRALGVHPCPAVAGDCSRHRGRGWWPDLARQRQPRLGCVWRLVSRAGGSLVHHRPDAEQAVGLVGVPADRFSSRRHARARARVDRCRATSSSSP
jgi:hypothetical protein